MSHYYNIEKITFSLFLSLISILQSTIIRIFIKKNLGT